MPGKYQWVQTRGPKPKRRDALVINSTRGKAVLAKLGMRRDTTVGALYDKYHVDSWNKVLAKVFG